MLLSGGETDLITVQYLVPALLPRTRLMAQHAPDFLDRLRF